MSFEFKAEDYGLVAAALLTPERVPPLGPGRENKATLEPLDNLTVDELFRHDRLTDRDMAQACISGLWLYHDYLERSHAISQTIETPTGAYWHGIMHRREPDFPNAKYWFRKVGNHPIFPALAEAARDEAARAGSLADAGWLRSARTWDPMAFIDLCEAVYEQDGPDRGLCERVALAEWQLLFDFSHRKATE
jgi:hypothetical protein